MIKEKILEAVTHMQGCKALTLIAEVRGALPELITELIDSGDLREIEYILPTMPYRIKSFLLPKGTDIL